MSHQQSENQQRGLSSSGSGQVSADKSESEAIVWRGQARAQSTSFYHNLELKTVVHSFSGHHVVYNSTWRPFQQDRLAYKGPDLQMY